MNSGTPDACEASVNMVLFSFHAVKTQELCAIGQNTYCACLFGRRVLGVVLNHLQ